MNQESNNPFLTFAVFLIYVSASCVGLFLMKTAVKVVDVKLFCGVFLYGLGAVLWIYILRQYPITLAFPTAAGSLMIATVLMGVIFLGEKFTVYQYAGVFLLILGIIFVNHGK